VTNFESGRPTSLRDVRYEEACNRLAVEAVKRGCTDNVTVMIVDVRQPATATKDSQEETVAKEPS
jgi:serine/threonine protein phosphatase PrpC